MQNPHPPASTASRRGGGIVGMLSRLRGHHTTPTSSHTRLSEPTSPVSDEDPSPTSPNGFQFSRDSVAGGGSSYQEDNHIEAAVRESLSSLLQAPKEVDLGSGESLASGRDSETIARDSTTANTATDPSNSAIDQTLATSSVFPITTSAKDLLYHRIESDRLQTIALHSKSWLDSLNAPLAGIYTFPQCMCLSNVDGSGEMELVVADVGETPGWLMKAVQEGLQDIRDKSKKRMNKGSEAVGGMVGAGSGVGGNGDDWTAFRTKIRCYRGNRLMSESIIPDPPTSLVSFYPDANLPRTPMLALASGPHIYMYRQRKPFFKFTLPNVAPDPLESEVWSNLKEAIAQNSSAENGDLEMDPVLVESAYFRLKHLREQANTCLTHRSQRLVSLRTAEERFRFVQAHAGNPLIIEPAVTFVTTMPRTNSVDPPIECLIVGSEERLVYIISPPNFSIIDKFQLSSPIVYLSSYGVYENGDYRIAAVCRDNHIYLIAPDTCYRIVQLEVPACGLVMFERSVVVGFPSYLRSQKGRLLFVRSLPSPIVAMCEAKFPEKFFHGYVVSLANGEVRLYKDRMLLTAIYLFQPAVSVAFGVFGREPGALVMVQKNGCLTAKILKRQANLDEEAGGSGQLTGPPREQDVPIPVPRKTKLFVEQMQREKRKGGEMYRDFERGLMRLKQLADANHDAIVDTPLDIDHAVKSNVPIQLEIELAGMGPEFLLILRYTNPTAKPIRFLSTIVLADPALYLVENPIISVGLFPPEFVLQRFTKMKSLDGISGGTVKVLLCEGRASREWKEATILSSTVIDIPPPAIVHVD
ncbi:Bardet-Biedl syndrome 1 protein [Phlyctochytrium planicorne]|nr:Bardet-Biedl syndrome 1 protein [Phlyctochytrium planicorne]